MSQEWFAFTQQGAVNIVTLSMPLHVDSEDFDRASDALLQLIGTRPDGKWVLDLSQLDYMGSSALGLMVNIRQRIKQSGGRLVLCKMSARLLQVFRTCCLERLFVIRPELDDAVEAVVW